jgi:hypothetical protein
MHRLGVRALPHPAARYDAKVDDREGEDERRHDECAELNGIDDPAGQEVKLVNDSSPVSARTAARTIGPNR